MFDLVNVMKEILEVLKELLETMKANKGDYIITGIHGEQYPCKPDIFKQTYEEISDE